MKFIKSLVSAAFLIAFLFSISATCQSTAFHYQGVLNEGSLPVDGTYQFQFRLFSALTGGTQIGETVAASSVTVAKGIFSVELDFGVNAYTGEDRFLEIEVKKTQAAQFTLLSPRQRILSAPYSVKSKITEISGDNPALQAFQASANLPIICQSFGGFPPTSGNPTLATVPIGKRAVIEYFTATDPNGSDPLNPIFIQTTLNGISANHRVFRLTTTWAQGSLIKLFADQGTQIKGFQYGNNCPNPGTVTLTISGYFVNLP